MTRDVSRAPFVRGQGARSVLRRAARPVLGLVLACLSLSPAIAVLPESLVSESLVPEPAVPDGAARPEGAGPAPATTERLRVVILTDISNEPDDQMSLVRFLTYADEFDVEGILATTSCWRKRNPDLPGIHAVLDAYARVEKNLRLHSDRYPTADALRRVTRAGVDGYGMEPALEQLDNEGVRLLVEVLERDDPRPIWFCAWGGGNTLGAAVHAIRKKHAPEAASRILSKIRGYEIALQDDGWAYIAHQLPGVKLISARLLWKGISRTTEKFNAWPESRGGNNEVFSAEWVAQHVQREHGPLGEKYLDAEYLWEGDTPSFLYLVPNGLNSPEHVEFGGWGGRFEATPKLNVRSGTGNNTVDALLDRHRDYTLHSDAKDRWLHDGVEYHNEYATVFRWREDFQRDFQARMDRCVRPFAGVNHAPRAQVNGDASLGLIRVKSTPGEVLRLDASGSTDPDADRLEHVWWIYPEPGTYRGAVAIENADRALASVRVPADAAGTCFHIILTTTDDGSPPLRGYRRVVVVVDVPETGAGASRSQARNGATDSAAQP